MSESHPQARKRVSRILVVDDDGETREALKELLEVRGHEVVEAPDGKRALDHLLSGDEPSVLVLDLEMPEMSGPELVDVMSRYYRLARIPVVVLSGSSRLSVPEREPVVGYLSKPCDADLLVEKITKTIESRSAQQAGGTVHQSG